MPSTPTGIVVEANGHTVTVNITTAAGAVPVYTSADGNTLRSLPAAYTTRTEFWLPRRDNYIVSMLVDGTENANGRGGTRTVDLTSGGVAVLQAGAGDGGQGGDADQDARNTGAYRSITDAALARWRDRRRTAFMRDNALAFDYYVDSVGGLDTNDGLTVQTPWQTLTKVNTSATLTAGKRVGLKRGSTFRTAFTVPGTGGSAAQPIVFGSYGTGKLPVIKGSTQLSATWTLDSGTVYKATTAVNPASGSAVYIDDDSVLTKAADRASMTAGTFFSDGTTMYVWLADSTTPTGKVVDYTNLTSTLLTCAVPHVIFQDISWKHGKNSNCAILFNATAATSVGMQVKRCDIGPNIGGSLLMGCAQGLVEDNYFHDNWSLIDYPSASEGGAVAFTTNTDGTECRYNVVAGNSYKGIRALNSHANLLIHHNIVIRPKVNGIDVTGGTAGKPCKIYNNFVWLRTSTGNGHGIDLQSGTASSGTVVKNNIVYCDDTFASPPNLELYTIDATTYVGVDWNNNLGYRTAGCTAVFGKVGLTGYSTVAAYKAAFQAAYGATQETNTVEADPLLALVTWPGGKFVPTSGSPCIDGGAVVGGTDADAYLGLPDYLGTAPDIGPYEVI